MVLDTPAAEYVAERQREGAPTPDALTVAELRASERLGRDRYGAGPEMAWVEDLSMPVDRGRVRVRILYPVDEPETLVLYMHGGGWVTGEIEDYEALLRTLASEAGCAIAIVEYRKAPEHRFPVAAMDAIAAYHHIPAHVESKLGRPVSVVVAGDSAGANLAAVVAQFTLRGSSPTPTRQILIYPVLDCTFTTPSYQDPHNQLLLTKGCMQWYWDQYVPSHVDRSNVMASPGRAGDLAGSPPTLLVAAEHDVLRSEGETYVRRLREQRVPVSYDVYKGQIHGFFSLHNVLPASSVARKAVVQFVRNGRITSD